MDDLCDFDLLIKVRGVFEQNVQPAVRYFHPAHKKRAVLVLAQDHRECDGPAAFFGRDVVFGKSGQLVRARNCLSQRGVPVRFGGPQGAIAYLQAGKLPEFLQSNAGAVLVPAGFEEQNSASALIEVANPSLAFSLVLEQSLPKRAFAPG